ncbi:hypothetical protein PV327_000722 [Microctonus hyperodae]|uniref:Zinc finger protein ZPR1 n=1 Tax=Microctonus hyperodae TaxID=165561 RepID=A0AA39G793_MICHY|nr:hypothetical protein PV327_000722 [Microctonus hyperodae]
MTEDNVQMEQPENKPIFRNLTAEDSDQEITTVESLCVNCGHNGITKILLTKIPHYKDIILMSFVCEKCGFENSEVQNGGQIKEKGVRIELKILNEKDLNRQVVKSDFTSVRFPKLDFEIPAQSQKGEITTVEGIIDRSINGLEQDQPRRREENPEVAAEIDLFIVKLRTLKLVDEPFTVIFEDISGECHVENPNAPQKDHQCTTTYFVRSEKQNNKLGIYSDVTDESEKNLENATYTPAREAVKPLKNSTNTDGLLQPLDEEKFTLEEMDSEVLTFPTNCPECNCPCTTNMKMTKIPHFKEVVIMATNCDACGHRTNEVKSGSGIEPEGIKIEVLVKGKDDFSRDVLKSDTCAMEILELDLEVGPTALGGRFTTIEGILTATKEQLTSCTAISSDSTDAATSKRMDEFIGKLDEILEGKREVTILLDDPAGNSYVQSLSDDGCDERLKIIKYKRSFQQNEDLGLNDMKIENY